MNDKKDKNSSQEKKGVQLTKSLKNTGKFGVLGSDLSSKFQVRSPKSRRPAVYGGRNGNGKPT